MRVHLLMKAKQVLKWTKASVDFIQSFLGRRCKTCEYFNEGDKSCDLLTYKVREDAYCDGWVVKKGLEPGFMNTEPSRRSKQIIADKKHSDKATPRYYDNITGVCCATCKYYEDPTWCIIVKGKISYICCCDAWDDGDRLGLDMAKDLIAEEKKQFDELVERQGRATHYNP